MELIRKNRTYLLAFLFLWLLLIPILLVFSKAEIHLYLNGFHNQFFDSFFKNITHWGDGLTPTFIAVVFLFISYRKALIIGVSAIAAGLLSQFFKRVVFKDIVRPAEFFKDIHELYFVPGVEVHSFFSFPSGHSTTSFCLAFCLASFSNKKSVKLLLLVVALLAGYSRIYLSQHFLIDVYFGAILGTLVAIACTFFFQRIKNGNIDNSLMNVFQRSK